MSFITIEVEDEKFQSWLKRTKDGFRSMSETLKDVAQVVNENTLPITPFETGKLGRSFKWSVLENNSKFQIVQLRMSALNPRTGYDYAWIQHEADYGHYEISSYDGKAYKSNPHRKYINDSDGWSIIAHKGQRYYLRDGVLHSQEDAFEMIEEDYLSLFIRGHIY